MTLEEKIKKINKTSPTSVLVPLKSNSTSRIAEFWDDVVEPLLPDFITMEKWHNLLIEYISQPDAVFMIRKGNEESKRYIERVPADALRRGFLTKTDADYWFTYNDNDFATYMLAMVLDGDIIGTLKPRELLEYLKKPNSIIRFNQSGKGGVEKEKAYYKIDGTQPRISRNGYTVAHIFDVNNHYYDKDMGFNDTGGEDALKSEYVKIDKGMYSDYDSKILIDGKSFFFRAHYQPGKDARKFLEAHMLRFLDPLNYFCAPKDNMNGHVYCEFTDHINLGKRGSRRFKRISGYEHLLYYAHHRFKERYGNVYVDFLKRAMLPLDSNDNAFCFFANSSVDETSDYYGSEIIDAKYGNPLPSDSHATMTVAQTLKAQKNKIDLSKIDDVYLDSFKAGEIANQVLRVIFNSGKVSKADVEKWKTQSSTKAAFGFEKPLLSPMRNDTKGYNRYYAEPLDLYGEKLYLYSQWQEGHKRRLIKWIVDWVEANGSII